MRRSDGRDRCERQRCDKVYALTDPYTNLFHLLTVRTVCVNSLTMADAASLSDADDSHERKLSEESLEASEGDAEDQVNIPCHCLAVPMTAM